MGFLDNAGKVEMRCLLAQTELLESKQAEIDAVQQVLIAQIPQNVTSIRGVWTVTGAEIQAENR